MNFRQETIEMTNHGPHAQSAPPVRRRFMGEMVQGLGGIALASLLGSDGLLASDDEIQNLSLIHI